MRFVKTMIVALSGFALIQAVSAEVVTLKPRCEYCSEKEYTQEEADARFANRYNVDIYKRIEIPFMSRKDQLAKYEAAAAQAMKDQSYQSKSSEDDPAADLEFNGYKVYMAESSLRVECAAVQLRLYASIKNIGSYAFLCKMYLYPSVKADELISDYPMQLKITTSTFTSNSHPHLRIHTAKHWYLRRPFISQILPNSSTTKRTNEPIVNLKTYQHYAIL
ncbi:hypothetical protein EYC80_006954 [Monilinia laxa]|uniref:Uncharacterized protein n=1 Tax=Monilinia laxa TaxID=61186 RepID=A0A5N6K029_MONLA|nr:hypothetical protein EYC80_006954 [Monilinia laxa]